MLFKFNGFGNTILFMIIFSTLYAEDLQLVHRIKRGDIDSNGNFYMLGSGTGNVPSVAPAGTFYSASNAGSFDMSFHRFSPADSLTWSTCIGGSGLEGDGGIYIRDSLMVLVGNSYSTNYPTTINAGDSGHVNFDASTDIVMTKFNLKTGQILWSAYHSTSANEYPHGVVLDQNYNMFVAGYLTCTGTSGACNVNTFKKLAYSGYYNHPTQIGSEAFILGFNSTNKRRWTTQFGSTVANTGSSNEDHGYSLAISHDNKIFMAGESNAKNSMLPLVRWNSVCYYDSVMADSAKLGTNYDAYIAMFEIEGFHVVGIDEQKQVSITEGIVLFPNPNNGIFTLRFTQTQTRAVNVHVMNVLGQVVYSVEGCRPNEGEIQVNPGTLKKGIYFISISDGNKSGAIKFIIN
ncbi:MAG: T9SS type A sorting domain-containing protein [Bacteroidia bacterium]|jgi:hypothetical protein|nr:T9SS type A sorting domain-containing protein [Bacteroidia bacterium]